MTTSSPFPEKSPVQPSWPKLVLRRADQAAAAVVLIVALAALGSHWGYQHWRRSKLIEIDRSGPLHVQFQLDINEADWPEFCLLPGIGETLAKRIVDYRRDNGPFSDLDSLRDVRGIGPKTLNGIKPYLVPVADIEATAEQSDPALLGLPKG